MWATVSVLALVLEVVAWVSVFRWGWAFGHSSVSSLAVGTLALVAITTVWGVLLSPRAVVALPLVGKVALQVVAFACVAPAFASVWGRFPAGVFFMLAVLVFAYPLFIGGKS